MSRALVVAVLAASACSDDPIDLSGIYQVQSHVGSKPCGTDLPVMMPAVYLKLEKMNFFADYFAVSECPDATGVGCSGGGLFDGLFEPIDNGWRGVATSSSPAAPDRCALSYNEDTAILNGSHLTVESSHHVSFDNRPMAECTTDKAEELAKSLPCEEHEVIEAEKR